MEAKLTMTPRCGGLRAEELRFQIGVERGVPVVFCRRVHAGRVKDCGVVDQNIQPAKPLPCLVEKTPDLADIAQISTDCDGASSEALDFRGHLLRGAV